MSGEPHVNRPSLSGTAALRQVAHTLKEIMMTSGDPRQGRAIHNYPLLSRMTGGLDGLWIIGGPTGAGKTTFALNLVAHLVAADPELQILYLDFELGAPKIVARLVAAFGAEAPVLAQTMYYRDLPMLDADRRRERRPVIVIIDTVQKLGLDGGTSDQRRAAIDAAVRQFERWKIDDGHTVIAVSQAGRASYDRRPGKADFKESGGIEEAADVALHVWQAATGAPPRVSIAKLRDEPLPGYEIQLQRAGWRLDEERLLPLKQSPGEAGGATTKRLSPVQRAITKVGAPARTESILRALGMVSRRRSTGERHITEAVRRGEIRAVRRGEYVLATAPPSLISSLSGEGTSEGLREAAMSA